MKVRAIAIVFTAAVLFILLPENSQAHKVGLFAYQEKGTVYTEAYFVDGTPCRNSKVIAHDTEGAVIAEGTTDDEGLFSFPYRRTGDLRIVVRAGMGHGTEILFQVGHADTVNEPLEPEGKKSESRDKVSAAVGHALIDEAAIEKIVEDKVAPIRDSLREIQKTQERPTLEKIIGGLGWIVGLAGAYLWGVSRRKNGKGEKGKG